MDKYYHITIDDGAPLPTEDDMKAFAEKIGITYEDYLAALDNHILYNEIYEYVRKLHKRAP